MKGLDLSMLMFG